MGGCGVRGARVRVRACPNPAHLHEHAAANPNPNPNPNPSPNPNPNPAIASWAGNITYTLDPQTGLVAAQTDVWNITRLDAIRQSFTPGPRTE